MDFLIRSVFLSIKGVEAVLAGPAMAWPLFSTSHAQLLKPAHCFSLNPLVRTLLSSVMASVSFSGQLPEELNKPDDFAFPKWSFGKKQSMKRSF